MQEHVEIFVLKHYYPSKYINQVLTVASHYGLHGVNLHPLHLEHIDLGENPTKIFVYIDYPIGTNHTIGRAALIQTYCKVYGKLIEGFNVAPLTSELLEDRWEETETDLSILCKICHEADKKIRVIIDLSKIAGKDILKKLAELCEQLEIDYLLVGSTNNKLIDTDTALLAALNLKQEVSIPIGVFGNINKLDIAEGARDAGLVPIVILPKNISQIFEP